MAITYLEGHPWSSWSREERFFCAALFEHAHKRQADFATWVNNTAGLGLPIEGKWDIGYEVCFYRDFLWQKNRSARKDEYSAKMTFDLCAFGERAIIISEGTLVKA